MLRFFCLFLLFLSFFSSLKTYSLSWKSYGNDKFRIYFDNVSRQEVERCYKVYERTLVGLENLTGNELHHVPILLEDYGLDVNGFADPLFFRSRIAYRGNSLSSSDDLELILRDDCADVLIHEGFHLYHMTETGGFMGGLRTVFGRVIQPNMLSPGWLIEGLAVYAESTLESPYAGRLNIGVYEGIILTKAYVNKLPTLGEAQFFDIEYPNLNSWYVYGSYFAKYLANTYGKDKIRLFIEEYGRGFYIYSLNNAAKTAFQKPFEDLWDDWRAFEKKQADAFFTSHKSDSSFAQSELPSNNNTPPFKKLTSLEREKVLDFVFDQEGNIIFITKKVNETSLENIFVTSKIYSLNLTTQKQTLLYETKKSISSRLHLVGNKLYISFFELFSGYQNITHNGYGFENILMELDLETQDLKEIYIGPFRDFVLFEDGFYVIEDKKEEYGSNLYFIKNGTKELKAQFTKKVGGLFFNKELIITAKDIDTHYNLFYVKEDHLVPIYSSPFFQSFPQSIQTDDSSILFLSQENWSLGIYEFKQNQLFKIQDTEFSATFRWHNDRLYFIRTDENIADIVVLNKIEKKAVKTQTKKDPLPIETASSSEEKPQFDDNDRDFSARSLAPSIRMPFIDSMANRRIFGLLFVNRDLMDNLDYTVALGFDAKEKRNVYNINLGSQIFSPLEISLSFSNYFYHIPQSKFILSSPLYLSQISLLKEYSLGVGLFSKTSQFSNKHIIGPTIEQHAIFQRTTTKLTLKLNLDHYGKKGVHPIGVAGGGVLTQAHPFKGQFSVSGFQAYHVEDPYSYQGELSLLGKDEPPAEKQMVKYTVKYTQNIASIQKWPTYFHIFYLKDIFAEPFYEVLFLNNALFDYTYGISLNFRTYLFLLPVPLIISIIIGKDQKGKTLSPLRFSVLL